MFIVDGFWKVWSLLVSAGVVAVVVYKRKANVFCVLFGVWAFLL